MEVRPSAESPDLLKFGIYTRATLVHKDFRMPKLVGLNGSESDNLTAAIAIRRPDKHDQRLRKQMIDFPNLDMRRLLLKTLIHLEMQFMKEDDRARTKDATGAITHRVQDLSPFVPVDETAPTPGRKLPTPKRNIAVDGPERKNRAIKLNYRWSVNPR